MADSQGFRFYYVLASKGIQEFILRGDKLRLMVGGSELVEGLATKFLPRLLGALGCDGEKDYLILSTAAGGAKMLFRQKEKAEALARILPPALALYAPGLDCVQTLREIQGSLLNTMEEAEKDLQRRRNRLYPSLPVAGPLVRYCPRSGLPVQGKLSVGDRDEADGGMMAKERAFKDAKGGLLGRIFSVRGAEEALPLPRVSDDLSQIVGKERGYLALLHADGNGLGALVRDLFEQMKGLDDRVVLEAYRAFCEAVDRAAKRALAEALEPLIPKDGSVCPFRPLICAGDDVTLVLRASDALGVARDFLERFEEYSKEELAKVPHLAFLKDKSLTACAGVAFVKRNYPFYQAYELCESLCKEAKSGTRRQASALAFWRVTTSLPEEFEQIRKRELVVPERDSQDKENEEGKKGEVKKGKETRETHLTLMPYVVGEAGQGKGYPSLGSLEALLEAVQAMPRGSLRGLLSEVFLGQEKAQRAFERVCDVAKGSEELRALQDALGTLTGGRGAHSLFRESKELRDGKDLIRFDTPLWDAVELASAVRERE